MGDRPQAGCVRYAGRAGFEITDVQQRFMITSIQGILSAATPLRAIVELNGFGYEVNIPVTTAEKLPATGSPVKLHTLVIYREDAQTLYGFATVAERDFFRLM